MERRQRHEHRQHRRIEAEKLPGLPHVACFDTAFHRGHPQVAERIANISTLRRRAPRPWAPSPRLNLPDSDAERRRSRCHSTASKTTLTGRGATVTTESGGASATRRTPFSQKERTSRSRRSTTPLQVVRGSG